MERVEVRKECVLSKTSGLTCRLCAHIDEQGNISYSVALYEIGVLHGARTISKHYDVILKHYLNVEALC